MAQWDSDFENMKAKQDEFEVKATSVYNEYMQFPMFVPHFQEKIYHITET